MSKIVTQASGNDTVYLSWYAQGTTVPTTENWMLTLNLPNTASSPTVTQTGAANSTSTAINNALSFQVGANASYDIDELKLGESYASVTSVPEPPAVTYVLLSILFLAGTRWFGSGLRNESSNVI